MEIVELIDLVYFAHSRLEIVLQPDEMHAVVFQINIAGAVILIPWLAYGAYIDDSLFLVDNRIRPAELVGRIEIRLIEKYTRHVRMSDEANVLNLLE